MKGGVYRMLTFQGAGGFHHEDLWWAGSGKEDGLPSERERQG